MIEILGYIAQALFIAATSAQALKSYRDGHSEGVSHGLIWMSVTGFTIMITYVIIKIGFDPVLMFGYMGQALFCLTIGWYKYFPRKLVVRELRDDPIPVNTDYQIPPDAKAWVWNEEKACWVGIDSVEKVEGK